MHKHSAFSHVPLLITPLSPHKISRNSNNQNNCCIFSLHATPPSLVCPASAVLYPVFISSYPMLRSALYHAMGVWGSPQGAFGYPNAMLAKLIPKVQASTRQNQSPHLPFSLISLFRTDQLFIIICHLSQHTPFICTVYHSVCIFPYL